MPWNSGDATNRSNAFRNWANNAANLPNRTRLIDFLFTVFAPRERRSAELWVTNASVRRNFFNNRTAELEYDLRVWLAENLLRGSQPPGYPVRTRLFTLPLDAEAGKRFLDYAFNNYIREYTARIYFSNQFLVLEYSADSSNDPVNANQDSFEFDGV